MNFWVIKTYSERDSYFEYITTTLEDAKAHRKEYCSWYCGPGDVAIIKIDQNFREIERMEYNNDKIVEHYKNNYSDSGKFVGIEYLIKNGRKVRRRKDNEIH